MRQRTQADRARVRPALVPGSPSAPCLLARSADEPGLGLRTGVRQRHDHGARAAAAREDRRRARPPALPRDDMGRGLPLLAVIELALIVAASTLAAGLAGALALRLLPSVSARLAGLSLLAVGLPLAAVLLSGVAMFHMGADVVILAVAAASSTVAIAAALFVGRSITAPVDRLRAVSGELAGGDLSARAPEQGPTEIAELGAAFNGMAARVEGPVGGPRQLCAWGRPRLRPAVAALPA